MSVGIAAYARDTGCGIIAEKSVLYTRLRMKKLFDYLAEQTWTLAGVGLVLITLSGPTLRQALWLTGVALVLHSVLTLTGGKDE